jgi:hypothetical protein
VTACSKESVHCVVTSCGNEVAWRRVLHLTMDDAALTDREDLRGADASSISSPPCPRFRLSADSSRNATAWLRGLDAGEDPGHASAG